MNKLLTLTTFLPLLGALMVLAGGPALKDEAARWVALGASIVTFIVSLVVLGRFDPSAQEPFQMVEQARWVESIGLTYTLGVDGVSIWMTLLTIFMRTSAAKRLRTRVAGRSWYRGAATGRSCGCTPARSGATVRADWFRPARDR